LVVPLCGWDFGHGSGLKPKKTQRTYSITSSLYSNDQSFFSLL